MCFVLYAGTTKPLSRRVFQKDAPDLSVESLDERDAAIREHFSKPEVQYIGSTSGCGCDFPNVALQGLEWPFFEELEPKDPERKASDRHNREALVDLLRDSGEQTVELYGVWDGDFIEAPKAREDVRLERLLDSSFRFKEQGFYRVRVRGEA
jgi:hypothetical protein